VNATEDSRTAVRRPSARHAAPSGRPTHINGLDGLRALAVGAVVVYHLGDDRLTGGFLGVDLFFVISGFLITSLLLTELERSGTIDLGRFYVRRARRLLPALLLMLAGTALLVAVFARDSITSYLRDLPGALLYVSNWWALGQEQSYFELIGRGPILGHLWSLAIEEQFYLIWPLLLVGLAVLARRRRLPVRSVVRWAAASGAVLSTALMTGHSLTAGYPLDADPTRVYFGTDTHAMTVLVGAALATMWRPLSYRRNVVPSAVAALTLTGAAALAASIWFFVHLTEYTPWLYRGGFLVVGLVFAVLIASVTHPASLWTLVLDSGPMRWIGERSYGIYLWHWPVFLITRPAVDVPWSGWWVDAARIGPVLLVAAASYRWVEVPIREGALAQWWHGVRTKTLRPESQTIVVAAAVAAAFAVTVGTSFAHPPASPADDATLAMSVDDTDRQVRPVKAPQASAAPQAARERPAKTADATATTPLGTDDIAWFGDSVTAWSADVVRKEVPGVFISAGNNRSPRFIQGKVAEKLDNGSLRSVVVMHMGTAGPVSRDSLGALLDQLEGQERVVLINSTARFPWVKGSNQALADIADRYDNVVLADWKAYSRAHPEWFKDGLHLTAEGKSKFARFVRDIALRN
jgi:peptidoglycan/LPS O-acetylase OafA/YrhL